MTIGHVHLRTAGIDRVRDFYVGVLGFDVVAEERGVPGWGTTGDVLFLSAGGYHHHLAFNTWKSKDGDRQPDGVAGLHHVAIRYPTRAGLADAPPCRRLSGRSARRRTTGRTRRSTSRIPTATTSSCAGTARPPNGRATSTATCAPSSTPSTSTSSRLTTSRRARTLALAAGAGALVVRGLRAAARPSPGRGTTLDASGRVRSVQAADVPWLDPAARGRVAEGYWAYVRRPSRPPGDGLACGRG